MEEWISGSGTRWIEGGKGPAVDELRLEELLLGNERGDATLRPEEVGRARKWRRWLDWLEMDRWDGWDGKVGCCSICGWLKARWMRAVVGRQRKTRGLVGENLDREEIPRWEVECGGCDWIGEEWVG